MVERESLGIDIQFEANSITGYKVVKPGEYVIHLRSFQGGFAFSEKAGICSPAYTILRPNNLISYSFLKEYFMSQKFIDSLRIVTYGIRDGKSISVEEWMKLRTCIPLSSVEQEKIKRFLSLLSERITIQNKIIEKYQSLIRAIIQRAQRESSKSVFLRDILTERKELNSTRFEVCSVSVSKGIINQVDYLGRSFAAKETGHYHVVREGDVVYTKSPTGNFPFGIIKQSRLSFPVSVSPLYGVYTPISYDIGAYLHYYFCIPQNTLNYLQKLVQKGAKNTINITNTHFLDNMVKIPDDYDLHRIITLVKKLSSRIENEETIISLLERQRDYFLRHMFV